MTPFKWKPRRWFNLAAVLVMIMGLIIGWRLIVPKSMDAAAREVLNAQISGDGQTLYAYSYDHERVKLGLTPEKLRKVYEQCVGPRLAGFSVVGSVNSATTGDGAYGEATTILKGPDGRTFELMATPVFTESGPRTNAVFHLLATAWRVEFVIKKGLPETGANMHRARILGLQADKAKLEAIGLAGVVEDKPDGRLVTWDEYAQREQERLNRYSITK